jgi:opacity protein-like surface antigen
MKRLLLTAAIALLSSASVHAQDIQPGQWELSVQTSGAGTDQQQAIKQCLSEADARDPSRVLMSSSGGTMGCQLGNQRSSAGHMDFSVSCSAGPGIGGRGSVDYTSTTLQGSVTLEFRGDGAAAMPGGITSRLSGRRVGSC